jgi:hypothetical protein
MITEQYTLSGGRVVTFGMPDLYKLCAMDSDIPSKALVDILDLVAYGVMDSGHGDDEKRLDGNRRFLMSQFQLAALVIQNPRLVLMGDAKEDDLTPADLVPRDLKAITEFFQTGGRSRVSTTTDSEHSSDTQPDRAGETMEQATE